MQRICTIVAVLLMSGCASTSGLSYDGYCAAMKRIKHTDQMAMFVSGSKPIDVLYIGREIQIWTYQTYSQNLRAYCWSRFEINIDGRVLHTSSSGEGCEAPNTWLQTWQLSATKW